MDIITKHTVIRPIEGDQDIEGVLEVYRQCEDFLALGPVATASMAMVRADLLLSEKEGCTFCGVFDRQNGTMLAIVDFSVSGFHGDPTTAYLFLLMIAAPNRGQGLGEEIVRAVEGEMRRAGKARGIESGVQVNNPTAIRFWQRMGYKIVSEARDMGDGTTAFQLWKDL